MINIKVFTTNQDLDLNCVKIITSSTHLNDNLVLAMPTGNTVIGFYKILVQETNNVFYENIRIFMLDTYYPQDTNNPLSFYSYIKKNLLDHINLLSENFHILDSNTQNPDLECQNYEKEIQQAGGIDLAILGLGGNGHIAFNEPGTSSDSVTHLAQLTPETLTANGNIPGVTQGLTMGIKTIMSAKKIILLAKGKAKAKPVCDAVRGPISEECPASFLQTHPDVTFFLDSDAASLL